MVKSVVKSLPEVIIDLKENAWILVLHLNDNLYAFGHETMLKMQLRFNWIRNLLSI